VQAADTGMAAAMQQPAAINHAVDRRMISTLRLTRHPLDGLGYRLEPCSSADPQSMRARVWQPMSVGTGGTQASANDSTFGAAISAGGRFVTFTSEAGNLVAGDTNGVEDVFLRDRKLGTTKRVSVGSVAAITPDGRFVAFVSGATNLVRGDTNQASDVFIRCRFAPCR
jgi:hypothetical protein